jgi:hypothetical protein
MSSAIDRNDMSHHQHRPQPRDRHTHRRVFRRSVLVWVIVVAILLVAAVPAVFYLFAHVGPGASATNSRSASTSNLLASPADRFMKSIVTGDGALGWHQLCPSIQAQLPLAAIEQQANTQRNTMAKQGVWLTATPVGTHTQQDGGVSHLYVVTAHWRSGATQSSTFTVSTQSSGCVEDVQN